MPLDPVSGGQLISSENQNRLVRTINNLLNRFRKKGDTAIGTGVAEQSETLSIPDGTGLRGYIVNLATKQTTYGRVQPEIPQVTSEPAGLQVGDIWIDLS